MSIHPTSSFLIRQPGDMIIYTTCKQCAEKSSIFNYTFCVTSLQSVPLSHATNLQGLALVAMELGTGKCYQHDHDHRENVEQQGV